MTPTIQRLFYYSPSFMLFSRFFLVFYILTLNSFTHFSKLKTKLQSKKFFYKNTFQTSASKFTKTKVVTRCLQAIRCVIHDIYTTVLVNHICSVSFF